MPSHTNKVYNITKIKGNMQIIGIKSSVLFQNGFGVSPQVFFLGSVQRCCFFSPLNIHCNLFSQSPLIKYPLQYFSPLVYELESCYGKATWSPHRRPIS